MSITDLKYLVPGGPKLPTERGVALENEQRKAKLGQFQELFNQDRISPIQLSQAVDDVYKDAAPEQRAGVFTRMFNAKKAKAQDAQNAAGRQGRAQEEQAILAGAKPPAPAAPKPAPETSDTRARADYTQFTKDHPEYKGSFEQWKTEQGATGRAAGTPAKPQPAPKPPSPSVAYFNLRTKKNLADKKQGPPLTNEETAQLEAAQNTLIMAGVARMDELAKAQAQYNVVPVTPDGGGPNVDMTRAQVADAARKGTPFMSNTVGMATGMDKKNSMLAQSAIQQVDRMENVLKTDPNLTGPGAGQLTQLQTFLGTQDPDAQQFIISGLLGSEHGVAVFGGRNIHTIQDLNNALGNMKTNPKALRAALQVIRETMTPWVTAGGRLPAPRAAQGGGWTPPKDAPKAPKEDGKLLKADGKVIAKSQGGQWVQP